MAKFCVTTNCFVEAESAEAAHDYMLDCVNQMLSAAAQDGPLPGNPSIVDSWTKEAIPAPPDAAAVAWHLLDGAIIALQEQLSGAPAMEALVLLPLIGQAAALQSEIGAFNDAKAEQQPERNDPREVVL